MSKETKYLVFAIEYYRNRKGLTGAEVAELFARHGVFELILQNYYLYHIESPDNMVAEIDHYLETGDVLEA
ncbi:DUF3791 domain-containing protein [Arabiibacter massiliensis]|uniref:DUF3791 domain-containing protein n=1 Tax=Arabiibacter massiliensis TaxID=1870985 RepID=UPI0009BA257A|nr:DUF3791 domain-containing protein [Arabiibacter massiliensis]